MLNKNKKRAAKFTPSDNKNLTIWLETINTSIIHTWKWQITGYIFCFFNPVESVGSCWFPRDILNIFCTFVLFKHTIWKVTIMIFCTISVLYWIIAFFVTDIYTLIYCNQKLQFVAEIGAQISSWGWESQQNLQFASYSLHAQLTPCWRREPQQQPPFTFCHSHITEPRDADAVWPGSGMKSAPSAAKTVLPAHWGNAVPRRWSHDRVLCAHGHGDGNIFPLLLRHGLGFLQPKTEQRWGGEWKWERNGAALGRPPWFHTADIQVRLCAAAHCGWTHAHHLCQLLGRCRRSAVRLLHVLPWRWWNYQPHWKWHGLNSWWPLSPLYSHFSLYMYYIIAQIFVREHSCNAWLR